MDKSHQQTSILYSGTVGAVIAGILLGLSFLPVFYVMDNLEDEDGNPVSENGKILPF